MKNNKYCIAVMSVGSGVGQSIITACNLSKLPITTVGLGMNPFAFGAYDCDTMDYVPLIYATDYIPVLLAKCKEHGVDLIIPGSDDESLILSEQKELFEQIGVKVLVSDPPLIRLIRNKAKMCDDLTSVADIFVKSYTNKDIKTLLAQGFVSFPLIAKPLAGFASKGVEILLDESDLLKITENHIIQELAIPKKDDPFREKYLSEIAKKINSQISEISIQIVTDKKGNLIGKMASYNKLNNGVPIELLPYDDPFIWQEIEKLLPALRKLGHRGPLNIQGRWTDSGLKLFEMNARFTGITGWRALMGFNEVETCIKEWLNIESEINPLELNYAKFGIRQTTDKALDLSYNKNVFELSQIINKKILKAKKSILITGAGGFLGSFLVKELAKKGYKIGAFDLSKAMISENFKDFDFVTCFNSEDLKSGRLRLGNYDILIHCAFARAHCNPKEIAESLRFTSELFGMAAMTQIAAVINISSQAIYGTKQLPLWDENTPPMPETIYAQGKYASELMLENIHCISRQTFVTSLRLASLAGGVKQNIPKDILSNLVEKALAGETIEILGGEQQIERINIKDAVSAIVALLETDCRKWERVYNLGIQQTFSINEIVSRIKKIAKEKYNIDIAIQKLENNHQSRFGMNSNAFYSFAKWSPHYSLDDTIMELFELLK